MFSNSNFSISEPGANGTQNRLAMSDRGRNVTSGFANVGHEKSRLEKSVPEKFLSKQYEVIQKNECFEEPEVYDVRGSHESVVSAASCSVVRVFAVRR